MDQPQEEHAPLHSRSKATTTTTSEETMRSEHDRPRLMGFALEIRQAIFDMVLEETIVKATTPRLHNDNDPDEPGRMSKIEPVALCLVSKQVYAETQDRYHSRVTYAFPSCLSFVDVLSGWSKEKIRGLKNVYLRATPIVFPAPSRAMFSVDYEGEMMLRVGPMLGMFSPDLKIRNLSIEDAVQNEARGFPYENQDSTVSIQVQSVTMSGCWTRYMEYISPPMEDNYTMGASALGILHFVRTFRFDYWDNKSLGDYRDRVGNLSDEEFESALLRDTKPRYRAWRDEDRDYLADKMTPLEDNEQMLDLARYYIKQNTWVELRDDQDIILPLSAIVTADPVKFPACPKSGMRYGSVKVIPDDKTCSESLNQIRFMGQMQVEDDCPCCSSGHANADNSLAALATIGVHQAHS